MRHMMLFGFLGLLGLAGCHSTSSADRCATATVKSDVLATTQNYYLWEKELPATVDLNAYATPSALLNALTAQPRAEGKDRFFSYMSTRQEQNAFFDQGTNMGYGCGFTTRGTQIFIVQVFPGSGAAAAGFARGDELLAVAATAAGLDDAPSQAPAIVANGTLSAILSSATAGTTRFFRLKKAGGATVEVSATTALYNLDPVPGAAAPLILDAGGGHKVGYLMLRTFVETASAQLRTVMQSFRDAGVTDLIVDLRYNGGGRVDVAAVLLNLLRRDHPAGDVMYKMVYNDLHTSSNAAVAYGTEASAIAPARIAFIVTGSTASASELVINALQPYYGASLAIVGSRTYGKPVAQAAYATDSCDWMLMLISIQLVNASNKGSYFGGMPDADFIGVSCAAADDLTLAPGDPTEASTAAALAWITTGANPGGAIPAAATGVKLLPRVLHPQPNLVQRFMPGVY